MFHPFEVCSCWMDSIYIYTIFSLLFHWADKTSSPILKVIYQTYLLSNHAILYLQSKQLILYSRPNHVTIELLCPDVDDSFHLQRSMGNVWQSSPSLL